MEKEDEYRVIYRLTWIALGISLLSFALLLGINSSHGNVSIVLWLILLLISIFISLPLHGFILLNSLFRLTRGQGWALRWVYFYLLLAISGHVVAAIGWGDFDEVKDNINQKIKAIEASG